MKKESEQILRKVSDIELHIDDYEYIFSDFDSRPYSQKLISRDLLDEMRRSSKDKRTGNINVKFLIPRSKRNTEKEKTIKKRFKGYFEHKFEEAKESRKKILKRGTFFVLFGIFFMIVATFFLIRGEENYIITFLSVLSEPAGWFLFWEGLNLVIFDTEKKAPDLEFYRKMSKATVYFADFR